jgi:hypothetical protein
MQTVVSLSLRLSLVVIDHTYFMVMTIFFKLVVNDHTKRQTQGQACEPATSVNSHHAMHMKNPTDRIVSDMCLHQAQRLHVARIARLQRLLETSLEVW